jgi:hypothetical protein
VFGARAKVQTTLAPFTQADGLFLVAVCGLLLTSWCALVPIGANHRRAGVVDVFSFVPICGYRLGYQRQLGADALLTFATKKNPLRAGLGWWSMLRPAP